MAPSFFQSVCYINKNICILISSVRSLSGTLVERRTRDTDIAGSNPSYFFYISLKVWFMLLLQELRRKDGIINKLVSCQTFENLGGP